MKRHFITITCLLSLLTLGCSESEIKEQKNIFVSSVNDLSTQEPFYEVLIQEKDTLWRHQILENKKSFSKINLKEMNSRADIVFDNKDTLRFLENITFYKDLHIFWEKGYKTYIEINRGQELNQKEFSSLVENKSFETKIDNLKTPNSAFDIIETISFENDKITYYWEYFYKNQSIHKETETLDISFFEIDNQLFLILGKADNPYPIYKVTKTSENEISLTHFIDFEPKIKTYKKAESKNFSDYNSYSLCQDYYQSLYYHGDDVRYVKGLDFLLEQLQKDAPKIEGEGFINIHFTINCNGDVGRLGLEILDRNYQQMDVEPILIKHIVDQIRQLNDWSNLDRKDQRGSKDVKMFYLIQFANQQISEVCP